MPLLDLMQRNRELEEQALVDLDAILHKATQEHTEFLETVLQQDQPAMIDEAGDVVTNVLSANYRLGVPLPWQLERVEHPDPIQATIDFGKRNDHVQIMRKIYSRHEKTTSHEQIQTMTQHYLSQTLSQLPAAITLEELISNTLSKMEGRTSEYLPQIDLADHIATFPDFPSEGIQFKDITPLLKHPQAFNHTINLLASYARQAGATAIIWLDARGFIFWAPVAAKLHLPFIPARKPGKLPGEKATISYDLEYGSNSLSIHTDALQPDDRVVIIDDLLATGGTARAAEQLVNKLGAELVSSCFVIELDDLQWKEKLTSPATSLIHY